MSLEDAAAGASGEPKPSKAPSKSKASSARVEPFEKDVLDRLREEVLACVRRRSPNERRLAGLCRALAPHSALARTLLAEVGEQLVQKKAFDRNLFVAAVRGLGELSDKRAVPLVKAGAEHDVCATAALCAAAWLTDPALAPILNKAATQRSAHIAFTAELARVIRGESPGAHLRGLAPKIKESHRIALCAEVLVPIARIFHADADDDVARADQCPIDGSSTMRVGMGEATTRRQPRPASSTTSHLSRSRRSMASSSSINEPIGLVGFLNAGSLALTSVWVTTVATGRSMPMSRRWFCRLCCRA